MFRKGFTLIELLVVVGIIGLLAAVILASLNAARDRAKVTAGLSFAAQLDRVAGDLLTGKWEFDEGSSTVAADRSGNGYNGTLVGSPSWSSDTPTGSGWSLNFNGVNYVSIPDNYSLDIGLGSATRALWFKTSVVSALNLFRKSDGSNANGMLMSIASSGITCSVNGSPAASIAAAGAYNDNRWHHVACVFDRTANLITIYVDGVLKYSADISALSAIDLNAGSPVYIPASASGITGLIDSVHFFAKALTAKAIQNLYAEGLKTHEFAEK